MSDEQPRPHGADSLRPKPHSADSLRPRPQYGEYATPEEQRARIRQPETTVALESGVAPTTVARPDRPAAVRSPANAGSTSPRRADRIITVGLLAYGLITVIMSAMSLIDFPTVASTSMQMMGIPGEFTNVAQGRLFGAIAAIALVVGWMITAWMSWRRIRAGRIAWWVPLAGAAGSYLVVYALLVPAILGDPAFIQYVGSSTP